MRRFFYIKSTTGSVLHIHRGKLLEGEAMSCGRRLIPGYQWFKYRTNEKRCSQCEASL